MALARVAGNGKRDQFQRNRLLCGMGVQSIDLRSPGMGASVCVGKALNPRGAVRKDEYTRQGGAAPVQIIKRAPRQYPVNFPEPVAAWVRVCDEGLRRLGDVPPASTNL